MVAVEDEAGALVDITARMKGGAQQTDLQSALQGALAAAMAPSSAGADIAMPPAMAELMGGGAACGGAAPAADAAAAAAPASAAETVGSVAVKWGKQIFSLPFSASTTVGELKADLAVQTGVNATRQKLVGLGKPSDSDERALSSLKIPKKVMLIGTREAEIVKAPSELDAR